MAAQAGEEGIEPELELLVRIARAAIAGDAHELWRRVAWQRSGEPDDRLELAVAGLGGCAGGAERQFHGRVAQPEVLPATLEDVFLAITGRELRD